jgi:hypothetical protein
VVKVGAIGAITCAVSIALAGCGGGGGNSSSTSHTYVISPHVSGSLASLAKGIYVTIVSPVAIPTSLLTKGGNKIVNQAQGPQKCSYTKTAHDTHGPGAFLNGKKVTIKINGATPFTPFICSALKKQSFNPSKIAGG